MSVGNPNKFKKFDNLEKDLNVDKSLEKEADNARLYKNKGSRIKKELAFTAKNNKSKLA